MDVQPLCWEQYSVSFGFDCDRQYSQKETIV